jgi:hypothetical protein
MIAAIAMPRMSTMGMSAARTRSSIDGPLLSAVRSPDSSEGWRDADATGSAAGLVGASSAPRRSTRTGADAGGGGAGRSAAFGS